MHFTNETELRNAVENFMRWYEQTTAGPALREHHGLGSRPEPHDHPTRNSEVTNAIVRMQALIESADKLLDTFRQRFASVIAERPSTVAAKETGPMPIVSDLARHIHDQADRLAAILRAFEHSIDNCDL